MWQEAMLTKSQTAFINKIPKRMSYPDWAIQM